MIDLRFDRACVHGMFVEARTEFNQTELNLQKNNQNHIILEEVGSVWI